MGMTCVLLTGGIDLSVGSAMFLVAVIAGKLAIAGYSLWLVLPLVLLVGVFWGWLNAVFIVRLRVLAFMVTLAMLYVGRGLGLLISQTRAMNLPESFLELANARFWGVPLPVLVFGMVVLVSHTVLTRTAFGRQVYAVGSYRQLDYH